MSDITATAKVQIIVEVDCGAGWNESCTVGQINKQAAETARSNLLRALNHAAGVRIVGEPHVIGIITEKK